MNTDEKLYQIFSCWAEKHSCPASLADYLYNRKEELVSLTGFSGIETSNLPANSLYDRIEKIGFENKAGRESLRLKPENPEEEHGWVSVLSPLKERLLVYVSDKERLAYLLPVLKDLNRSIVLLCHFNTRTCSYTIPERLNLIEFCFYDRESFRNEFLESHFPDYFNYYNTFNCFLQLLRPEGLLIAGGTDFREKIICEAANSINIPTVCLRCKEPVTPVYLLKNWPYAHYLACTDGSSSPIQLTAPNTGLLPTGFIQDEATDNKSTCFDTIQMINQLIPFRYFSLALLPRLHIGCGPQPISGWLNVDLAENGDILYLDAGEPFPYPDASFQYIFSEHLFEHLSFHQGISMLRECRRILKPGGALRLAMPNLEFLIRLYNEPEKEIHCRYIDWSISCFDSNVKKEFTDDDCLAMFVVNNFIRQWGHKMVYDRETIARLLENNGFKNIVFYSPGESSREIFNHIERHGRSIPAWANELETMVVEAEASQ